MKKIFGVPLLLQFREHKILGADRGGKFQLAGERHKVTLRHCSMASKKDGIYIGSKLTGLVNEMTADCNSEKTCSNTDLDETMCTLPDNEDKMFKCRGTSRSTSSIPISAVCDLKCDCYLCDDEAKCNNVTYGMFCNTVKGGYVHAMYICDKKTHFFI